MNRTGGLPGMDEVFGKGPDNAGKYAAECSVIHTLVEAELALLVVIGGVRGHGMAISVDRRKRTPAVAIADLPAFLRDLADAIETTGVEGPPIPSAGNA